MQGTTYKTSRWLKNIHPIYFCNVSTDWPSRNLGRKNILRLLSTAYERRVQSNRQVIRIPLIRHFILSSAKAKHYPDNSVLLSVQAVVRNG